MFSPRLERLLNNVYYYENLPVHIRIPASGAAQEEITKPVTEATLDELELAARTLNQEADLLKSRILAVRRLYEEACGTGAPGDEKVLDALARQGGAQ